MEGSSEVPYSDGLDTVSKSLSEAVVPPNPQGKPSVNTGSVLDILRSKGIRPSEAMERKPIVEDTLKTVEAKRAQEAPKVTSVLEKPEVAAEVPEKDVSEVVQAAPEQDLSDPEIDKLENFKALRAKIKETKEALKAKDLAYQEITEKVSKYEKGEVLPETLKQREARISELERFERLHSLKTSPSYKRAFVEPVQQIQQKLGGIAKDYGLPEQAINQAMGLTNKRDLNKFLTEHFDDVGALEVKSLIEQAQGITQKAAEAEAEPARVMAQIEAEHNQIIEQEQRIARTNMAEMAVNAWSQSLEDIKHEGKLVELIPKATDIEYNKKYVDPVVNAAAKEHGELVTALANAGLKELPPKLAYGLARMIQLAHASATNTTARMSMEREYNELKENTVRETRYARPLSSGSAPNSGGAPEEGRQLMTPIDAARRSREAAMGKR